MGVAHGIDGRWSAVQCATIPAIEAVGRVGDGEVTRSIAILAALVLVLSACGTGTTESAGSSADATGASEAAQPSVSAAPSEAASGGEGTLCAEGHQACPIEAGTYTAAPFEPNFSFTIDDGWLNDRAFADGGGISHDTGGIYWASGVASGTVNEGDVEIAPGVDGFIGFLQSLEAIGMTVSEPSDATIDGAAGQQIDVETNEVAAPGLYFVAEDAFNLAAGEKSRFIVVDQGGETVVFVLDAFAASDFDTWVDTAQPVMDSISWEN
jgi:hypothetical protein